MELQLHGQTSTMLIMGKNNSSAAQQEKRMGDNILYDKKESYKTVVV